MGDSRVQILGGVDEAGFGPLLGPLVVAGLSLAGPAGTSPWEALAGAVRRQRRRGDRRLMIADSKRVKSGRRGLVELERTALSLLSLAGSPPPSVGSLWRRTLAPDELGEYPWYAGVEAVPLPRWADAGEIALRAHELERALRGASIDLAAVHVHPVPVGRFNALVAELDNKSLLLFEATRPVLAALVDDAERRGLPARIVCDRHGARRRYGPLLAAAFPGRALTTLHEEAKSSSYRLEPGHELQFVERGEDLSFPTAAASCLAKYVRELLVERLNAHFTGLAPELRPTAGYQRDGRRFLRELGPLLARQPAGLLVRRR